MTFRDLLTAFAAAVEANDGEGLASLFTEDGTYEDGFFGAHTGRQAIAVMLQRFHDTRIGLGKVAHAAGERCLDALAQPKMERRREYARL